jgi:recombination protein RecT
MTQTQTNNAPAQRTQSAPPAQGGVASMLNQMMPAIKRAMMGGSEKERQQKAERFARVALTSIRNNPQLARCAPESLMGALMTSASLNLEIDARGLAYLVPYKGEIQLQVGYKGLKELVYRSGRVKAIYAEVVYVKEVEANMVEVGIGLDRHLRHDVNPLKLELRTGALALAYAVSIMADGEKHFEFVTPDEVSKRRNAAQSKNSPAWNGWEEEMWKKTAIKKLCKALPISIDAERAVTLDDAAEAGERQVFDMDDAIDIDLVPADVPTHGNDAAKAALGVNPTEQGELN